MTSQELIFPNLPAFMSLQWNHQLLSQANLERFAEVVHRKGSPLDNCFGFVDGTVRPVCRPGTLNQRLLYNGHKRVHGIKFQSVVTPNGMIANMYGPVGNPCEMVS